MRKTIYRGYSIYKDRLTGYYYVAPPNAMMWKEPFINIKTAKKYVDIHIIDRRERSLLFKQGFSIHRHTSGKPFKSGT